MFYLVDKPISLSSFDVIRRLRKALDTKKIGHTGTLDPLASWLLLIATEKSTKLVSELEKAKKRYTFTVRMDGTSDSLDLGTPVQEVDTSSYRQRTEGELIDFLISQTSQIPPRYSALHVDGKRAYDLARAGQEFILEERPIQIEDVCVLEYQLPYHVTISLTLSSGWYIRSLAPVITWFFGIQGWYITELRRTNIYLWTWAILSLEMANSLEKIMDIPYSQLFPTIPTLWISWDQYRDIMNWKSIYNEGPNTSPPWKYFLDFEGRFRSFCAFDGEKYTIIRNDV